jgi:hypothetical protein
MAWPILPTTEMQRAHAELLQWPDRPQHLQVAAQSIEAALYWIDLYKNKTRPKEPTAAA